MLCTYIYTVSRCWSWYTLKSVLHSTHLGNEYQRSVEKSVYCGCLVVYSKKNVAIVMQIGRQISKENLGIFKFGIKCVPIF